MKLIKVRANYFRNIIDSTDVIIDDEVTCLVGKNESGKTAFLHDLYRLNPIRQNVEFSVHDQYPAWLEKKDRLKGITLEEVKPIQATFLLEDSEIAEVEEIFGDGVFESKSLVIKRDYKGTLFYAIGVDESESVKHFLSNIKLPQKLSSEVRKSKTFEELFDVVERVQARENVSIETKELLTSTLENIRESVVTEGLDKSIFDCLKKIIPCFFYFDKYSTLPYSVNIQRLLKAKESELNDGEITARSLLRLAAADDDYLLNPNYERRKRELENVANSLTDDVLTYWSQNPALRVSPDITQKTVSNPQGQQSVLEEIKFRIWDERHLLSLPFDEHSTGFQWFFSFLAAFSEFEFTEMPIIILLDEPALGLHAKAQKDFLRFIDERITPICQVIYTTHSPFMVQPGNLERVRVVEDKGRKEGTVITADVMSTDPDTLFPLQGALGYDMAQHLFIAPHNLVVEGTSDFAYLTVISDYLKEKENREYLDEHWSIVPVGGADLLPSFVALLGNHLDVTVLVDSQKAGHKKLSNLAAQGYLTQKRIIALGNVLSLKYADIEDVFEADDYLLIYNQAFAENIAISDLEGNDPIVSRIARFKNIKRFDHGKPADYFLRNRDTLLPKMSEETLSKFENLILRINSTMPK